MNTGIADQAAGFEVTNICARTHERSQPAVTYTYLLRALQALDWCGRTREARTLLNACTSILPAPGQPMHGAVAAAAMNQLRDRAAATHTSSAPTATLVCCAGVWRRSSRRQRRPRRLRRRCVAFSAVVPLSNLVNSADWLILVGRVDTVVTHPLATGTYSLRFPRRSAEGVRTRDRIQ